MPAARQGQLHRCGLLCQRACHWTVKILHQRRLGLRDRLADKRTSLLSQCSRKEKRISGASIKETVEKSDVYMDGYQAIASSSAATKYVKEFVKGADERPYYLASAFDRDWRAIWNPCPNCLEKNLAVRTPAAFLDLLAFLSCVF